MAEQEPRERDDVALDREAWNLPSPRRLYVRTEPQAPVSEQPAQSQDEQQPDRAA